MRETVLFRADGNASIGSGHVMRCLSIADAALKGGFSPILVTAGDDFAQLIQSRGYDNIVLHTDYQDMESETDALESLITEYHPLAIFIDSYYVTPSYLNHIKRECQLCATRAESRGAGSQDCKVIYIDDVLAFPYEVDYLLNYNIYGPDKIDTYHRLYNSGAIKAPHFLLGTSYAPLRAEFQCLPDRVVKKTATDILISTGGADFEHMTVNMIQAVLSYGANQGTAARAEDNSGVRNLTFHFIIGSMNPDRDKIHALADGSPHIIIHENVSSMSTLMQRSDLAISAAGSTLYELCATKTPTITYILADNQIPGAEGFQNHKVLECAGDVRESSPAELSKKLIEKAMELNQDYDRRIEIANRMKSVVDGRGAQRIIELILRT